MADTKTEGKKNTSMVMVQIPTNVRDLVLDVAKERNISANRWIAELVAKEFNVTLPQPGRKATSIRALFEKDQPQGADETTEAYEKRYVEYKAQVTKDANEKRRARTNEAITLMDTLKARMAEGTLDQASIAELLASLKS